MWCGHFELLLFRCLMVLLLQIGCPGSSWCLFWYYRCLEFVCLFDSSLFGKNSVGLLTQWLKLPVRYFCCKYPEPYLLQDKYFSYGQLSVDCQNDHFIGLYISLWFERSVETHIVAVATHSSRQNLFVRNF